MSVTRRQLQLAFTAVLALSSLQACLPTDTCACSQVPPGATIVGRVLDPLGTAVPTAVVEAWAYADGCQSHRVLQDRVDVDSLAAYRVLVSSITGVGEVCVDLLAIDAGAPSPDTARVSKLIVPVDLDYTRVIEQDIRYVARTVPNPGLR